MAKKLAIAGVFLIIIIGLAAIFTTAFPNIACEGQPINLAMPLSAERQIWGENSIRQEFVAAENGLNRIDIFFQTYFRQNSQDVTIRLLEASATDSTKTQSVERFQTTFNVSSIPAQSWHTFMFTPIPNSAQKPYIISIESSLSSPGDAVTVGGIIETDPYQLGEAFVGSQPLNGDIAFRSCYQMSGFEKIQTLTNQLTQHRPSLWNSPTFYGAILIIYAVLMGVLFWKLAKLTLG